MESLKINAGQAAKETLTELQIQIRKQRYALETNSTSQELLAQMAGWETMVQQLQTEMMLEKSAQLSLLYEVSRPINASLDWRRTLQAVMDAFIRITTAERGMLLVLDPDGTPQVEMTRNATREVFTKADLEFSRSVVQKALHRGSPVLTTNAQLDPRFEGSESIIAYGLRSILCAPLIHNGRALGAIYLDNRAKAGVFAQEDLATLSAFANQAAIALANAQEHQRTDQELSDKIRELTILQEMTRDLSSNLQFNRVMERGIAWAIAASGAEIGAIGLIAEEGIRWIAKVGDITPENQPAMRSIYTHEAITEARRLILPLVRDTRPIGTLYLVSEECEFKKSKLEFITRIADSIATAVENARLYEALRQANLAKSEFVSTMSQELRAPLSSIRCNSETLNTGIAGPLSESQQEIVNTISYNAERMDTLVNDFLDISLIETGRLKLILHSVVFSDVLKAATEMVRGNIERKGQIFSIDIWDGLPPAYADAERLKQILVKLLDNANKYTPERGSLTVKVWMSTEEPDFIRCAVSDTGGGISPEDQVHIFNKFFRANATIIKAQPGTGLGLTIAKSLVEIQGGRIWVESTPGKGSTFTFTVPIAMPGTTGMFS